MFARRSARGWCNQFGRSARQSPQRGASRGGEQGPLIQYGVFIKTIQNTGGGKPLVYTSTRPHQAV
eukprot:9538195-Lingulodinium_polyedra.AAC.1